MKNVVKKNQIIITALAIMIVVAGYLNFTGQEISTSGLVSSQKNENVIADATATPKETAKHRNEFNKIKSNLIEEWERNTGQKWPTYTEDVISPNTGKVVRKAGDKYDAHHVIENSFGGENEWWNIHPAKFPNEHQSGIHGAGSPANKLFKGGNK